MYKVRLVKSLGIGLKDNIELFEDGIHFKQMRICHMVKGRMNIKLILTN